jgi:hypothetical protein
LRVDTDFVAPAIQINEIADESFNAIVISDYDKGAVSYELIAGLKNKYQNTPMFLDTKKVKLENESLANKFLYEVTGITYDELNKYYNKLKWKCKTCHSSKRIGHTEDGYPGETFYHCKCGGYITTTMNYSEIE